MSLGALHCSSSTSKRAGRQPASPAHGLPARSYASFGMMLAYLPVPRRTVPVAPRATVAAFDVVSSAESFSDERTLIVQHIRERVLAHDRLSTRHQNADYKGQTRKTTDRGHILRANLQQRPTQLRLAVDGQLGEQPVLQTV